MALVLEEERPLPLECHFRLSNANLVVRAENDPALASTGYYISRRYLE